MNVFNFPSLSSWFGLNVKNGATASLDLLLLNLGFHFLRGFNGHLRDWIMLSCVLAFPLYRDLLVVVI